MKGKQSGREIVTSEETKQRLFGCRGWESCAIIEDILLLSTHLSKHDCSSKGKVQ